MKERHLGEILRLRAMQEGDKVAYIERTPEAEKSLTYRELYLSALNIAAKLSSNKPEKRVSDLCCPRTGTRPTLFRLYVCGASACCCPSDLRRR